jgi:hypothetical protein
MNAADHSSRGPEKLLASMGGIHTWTPNYILSIKRKSEIPQIKK